MKRGAEGDPVRQLQLLLQGLGFSPGEPDGVFGPLTEAAVGAFQRTHALTVTGTVDDELLRRLRISGDTQPGHGTPAEETLTEIFELLPRTLTGVEFTQQQRGLAAYLGRARAAQQLGYAECVARTAEWFYDLRVRETQGQNRGPWVDFIRGIGGGEYNAPNAWCAAFVSACWKISNWVRRSQVQVVTSESATALWIHAPSAARVSREQAMVSDVRGGAFVRTRSSDPSRMRQSVLDGLRVRGHTGIIVGRADDDTLICIAGNSSGAGHSRVSGSGAVAMEQIGQATVSAQNAQERLVGVVLYAE